MDVQKQKKLLERSMQDYKESASRSHTHTHTHIRAHTDTHMALMGFKIGFS